MIANMMKIKSGEKDQKKLKQTIADLFLTESSFVASSARLVTANIFSSSSVTEL